MSKSTDGSVSVTRERFKDTPELPPLAYLVDVVDLGYHKEDEPVTSCALVEIDAAPQASHATSGAERRQR